MVRIKPQVLDAIKARYEVLSVIDLFDYDSELDSLRAVLSKFNNFEFNLLHRIVILHHDTDYYIDPRSSGFTMYNLFVILKEFQIPTEFLILLTNHYGIEGEIRNLEWQTNFSKGTKVIYTSLWYDFPDQIRNEPTEYHPGALFCCLNNIGRSHRLLMLCFLKEHKLLSKGMVSYHFNNESANN